jgi:hypothetical protein
VAVPIPAGQEATILPFSTNGIIHGDIIHTPGSETIAINQAGDYLVDWNITLPSVPSNTNFATGLRIETTDIQETFVGTVLVSGQSSILSGKSIINIPTAGLTLSLVLYQDLSAEAVLPTTFAGVPTSNIQLNILKLST